MMQALPPPSPPVCVRSAEDITTLISVSGSPIEMAEFANVLKRYPAWKQEGEASGVSLIRMLVLRGPASLPYRDIGGLIYEAQRLKLAIIFTPSSPLCEDKAK